jgi:hypothetical protein
MVAVRGKRSPVSETHVRRAYVTVKHVMTMIVILSIAYTERNQFGLGKVFLEVKPYHMYSMNNMNFTDSILEKINIAHVLQISRSLHIFHACIILKCQIAYITLYASYSWKMKGHQFGAE